MTVPADGFVRNRQRVLVVDTHEIAADYRRVFTKKEPREEVELPFSWPGTLCNIGDSVGIAYASDKWKKDDDYELYKHLAESRNRALVAPSLNLVSIENPREPWTVYGPHVSFVGVPMPKHVAVLGYFEEINFQLYVSGGRTPKFGRGDEGYARVTIKHAMLAGGKIMWSKVRGSDRNDEPLLVVYTEPRGSDPGGVHIIIRGKKLDIEADGIVG